MPSPWCARRCCRPRCGWSHGRPGLFAARIVTANSAAGLPGSHILGPHSKDAGEKLSGVRPDHLARLDLLRGQRSRFWVKLAGLKTAREQAGLKTAREQVPNCSMKPPSTRLFPLARRRQLPEIRIVQVERNDDRDTGRLGHRLREGSVRCAIGAKELEHAESLSAERPIARNSVARVKPLQDGIVRHPAQAKRSAPGYRRPLRPCGNPVLES